MDKRGTICTFPTTDCLEGKAPSFAGQSDTASGTESVSLPPAGLRDSTGPEGSAAEALDLGLPRCFVVDVDLSTGGAVSSIFVAA